MSQTPEPPIDPQASAETGGQVVMRACLAGVGVAAPLVAISLLVLPASALPAESRFYLLIGALGGVVSGGIGNTLVGLAAMREAEDPRDSTGFVRAIVLDFALQAFAVVGGVAGLFLLAVKFQNLVAFGMAIAGVAVVIRVTGTIVVTRALTAKAKRWLRHRAALESNDQDSHT